MAELDRRLFELMIAVIARHWSAQFEWFAHMRSGLEAGLPPDLYESIRTRQVPKFENEQEKLVYELVNETNSNKDIESRKLRSRCSSVRTEQSDRVNYRSGVLYDRSDDAKCFRSSGS